MIIKLSMSDKQTASERESEYSHEQRFSEKHYRDFFNDLFNAFGKIWSGTRLVLKGMSQQKCEVMLSKTLTS